MSEFLFRVRDTTAPNFYGAAVTFKAGDVIRTERDHWRWGTYALTSPNLRIIRLDIPLEESRAWMAPEILSDPTKQTARVLKWRGFGFDLSSPLLPPAFVTWLQDDSRARPILVGNMTMKLFRQLKTRKPITADPAKVLGV